jgi:hypothetical protein
MKKILFTLLVVVSLVGFSKPQPKNSLLYLNQVDTTGIDTSKIKGKTYSWYGKTLTEKQYLDTIKKIVTQLNDSARKKQGIK